MTALQQQRAKRQQKIEELCATTLRALTGDAELHYRGHCLHRGTQPLPQYASHLRTDPERDGFEDFRAVADGMALRLLYSNAELHRSHCPVDPVERLIFELLEQLRVETLVPGDMPGMASNLRQRFDAWSRAFHHSGLTESSSGILLYTVAQLGWSRLSALPVLADTEDLIEATRAAIVPLLGMSLAGIRCHRQNQAAFAVHALEIARIVGETLRSAGTGQSSEESGPNQRDEERARFVLLLDFKHDGGDCIVAATAGESKALGDTGQDYRIYTTRFDSEVAAGTLARKTLLREYR